MTTSENDALLRMAVLGEATASLSHELRNVLQTIATGAYLLVRDGSGPEKARAERIEVQANLGLALVERVLSLARGEAIAKEAVALEALALTAREGLPASVTFRDEGFAGLAAWVDPVLFPRLLHVLYENAAQAAGDRAVVTTTAALEGETLVVTVEDDGPGVPEAVQSRIFQPLASARAGGTGLGLALARRIAEAHGGSLAFEGGSRFRLVLPHEAGR
jgi:signal transduction histidine kinase